MEYIGTEKRQAERVRENKRESKRDLPMGIDRDGDAMFLILHHASGWTNTALEP